MRAEKISTISSPIYRDIARTINETKFDLFIRGSYIPVLHYRYIQDPSIRPINMPDPMEEENWNKASYSLSTIIDMFVGGHEFSFRNSGDLEKAAGFLKAYIDQFTDLDVSGNPELKSFLANAKTTYDAFNERITRRKDAIARATSPMRKKNLSIDDMVKFMACQL